MRHDDEPGDRSGSSHFFPTFLERSCSAARDQTAVADGLPQALHRCLVVVGSGLGLDRWINYGKLMQVQVLDKLGTGLNCM